VSLENLIISTRVGVLRRNLEQVKGVVAAVATRRSAIDGLDVVQTLPTGIADAAARVNAALAFSRIGNWEEVTRQLGFLEREMAALATTAATARDSLVKLQRESVDIGDGGVKTGFEGLLKQGMEGSDEAMTSVQTLLSNAKDAHDHHDDARADARLREAWESYRTQLHEETQAVFSEYLDLLGGLAMRQAGFDSGTCRIADALIRGFGPYPDYTWNSLTVPARQEALRVTLTRIVRLGFPEWTIWALPLTAHEFGHVIVRRYDPLSSYAEAVPSGPLRDRREMVMADAFATCMIGPAYACAAILLRLDPADCFSERDGRLTSNRVATILSMLRRMSCGPADPFAGLTTLLESEWDAAVRQTGPPGALTEDEQREIAELTEKTYLAVTEHGLPPDDWPRIKIWANLLLERKPEQIVPQIDDLFPLRYLLNAAWQARLTLRDEDPEVQKERVAELAEAVRTTWENLGRVTQDTTRANGAASTPPSSPPPQSGSPRAEPEMPT
jgi:hypothetical protein